MSQTGIDQQRRKDETRKLVLGRVKALSQTDRQSQSAAIVGHLLNSKTWETARSVLLFYPLPGEPDILPCLHTAIAQNKITCLPRWNGTIYEISQIVDARSQLLPGFYKIPEPSPGCPIFDGKQLDLVLVPGVAWTRLGGRLGRGRGHYDRLLLNCGGIHCGIAWKEQIQDALPEEAHDRRVHLLMTADGAWRCEGTNSD